VSKQSLYSPIWKERAVYQHQDGTLYRCLACGPGGIVFLNLSTGSRSVIRRNGPHSFVSGPGPVAPLSAGPVSRPVLSPRDSVGDVAAAVECSQIAAAEVAPSNNMGGKVEGVGGESKEQEVRRGWSMPFEGQTPVDSDEAEDFFLMPTAHKKTKVVRVPRPDSGVSVGAAFVDQVSFTFKVSEIEGIWFTDSDFAVLVSRKLIEIFGFGTTRDRERGLNFYDSAFVLGDGWGHLCIGGQADTCLVQVTGAGCSAAKAGWERRLYEWLLTMASSRITRVDPACDIYDGKAYDVHRAVEDYKAGLFNCGGRRPTCEQDGNWIFPDGSGLTFYVGSRSSGKLLRVYEKARQLGGLLVDLYPDWVRVELELHNEDRVIPLDILIKPGQYLAGAYPALAWVSEEQSRIKTKDNTVLIMLERSLQIVKQQSGGYLYAFLQIFGSAEVVLDKLIRKVIPDRLVMPDWSESPPPLMPAPMVTLDEAFAASFAGGG
jgi:DNA relaxase NicK